MMPSPSSWKLIKKFFFVVRPENLIEKVINIFDES